MKILVVINNLDAGGAEKLIVESLPKLIAEGLDIEVLLFNKDSSPFLKQLEETNCPIHSLDIKNVYNPTIIYRLIPFFNTYELIHVHLFPALYWTALANFFNRKKAKLIYTEHSTNNKRRKVYFKPLEKFIYKQYSKIITISDDVDFEIKKHLGFKNDCFIKIFNGVDTSKYSLAKPLNEKFFKGSDDKILIQVSRFDFPKDHKTVIESLKHLPDNIKLILVGEGKLRKEMEAYTNILGLVDRVAFLGFRRDIPELLKSSDIIILSSHYEGLSLASIEGLSSGRPLISSDAPGISNIVKNAGILFPIGNHERLAAEIQKLLQDKDHYTSVVNRSIKKAKQFDIEYMVLKYKKLYLETF
jgi:glycosyltransferase involved in cell wall biosynthesis